jgi:hypothetical protein
MFDDLEPRVDEVAFETTRPHEWRCPILAAPGEQHGRSDANEQRLDGREVELTRLAPETAPRDGISERRADGVDLRVTDARGVGELLAVTVLDRASWHERSEDTAHPRREDARLPRQSVIAVRARARQHQCRNPIRGMRRDLQRHDRAVAVSDSYDTPDCRGVEEAQHEGPLCRD